jgi:hypothetical protein
MFTITFSFKRNGEIIKETIDITSLVPREGIGSSNIPALWRKILETSKAEACDILEILAIVEVKI